MADSRTVRERLREYVRAHPGITAADAARALRVSRQVVSRIGKEEDLELGKYRTQYPPMEEHVGTLEGELGARPRPPLVGAANIAVRGRHEAAVLLVAADLVARGFDVALPRQPKDYQVIIFDPPSGRYERIVVDTVRRRGSVEYPKAQKADIRRAVVVAGEPIEYQPPFLEDATRTLAKTRARKGPSNR